MTILRLALPFALLALSAASPRPAYSLTVDFLSVHAGTDRIDGVLDGATPHVAGFLVEGIDITSVRVTLPNASIVDLVETAPGSGEWENNFFFADLAGVAGALPNGTYMFTFNRTEVTEETVSVPFTLRAITDFASNLSPTGSGVPTDLNSINWVCTSTPCNDGQFGPEPFSVDFSVDLTEVFTDTSLVSDFAPITATSFDTSGLVLDPGTQYRLDVDLAIFADFMNPVIGGIESQYASFFSSDNVAFFTTVPEPASGGLAAAGLLAIGLLRRRS